MQHGDGNGSSRFAIDPADLGGWVRVYPSAGNVPDDLALFLSQTLAAWFRARPHLHMRSVAPINKNGDTWELHAWYEVHVLPPSPIGPQPSKEGER